MTLTTKILSVDSPNSRGAVNVFSGAPLDFVKVIAACLIGVDRGWIPVKGSRSRRPIPSVNEAQDIKDSTAVLYPFAFWELKCVQRVILSYGTKTNMPELRASDDPASHHGER
jgi:hypothetical protein